MADFEEAVKVILEHEGGYTNDANDPGGETNWGIILPVLREMGMAGDIDRDGDVDADDIRKMTVEDAKRVYKAQWWDRFHYNRIASQKLATKTFDLAVNMGPTQGHKILQRAITRVGFTLKDDGIIGVRTWREIEAVCKLGLDYEVVKAMRNEAVKVYERIIARNPKLACFRKGWMNRASW